MRSRAIKIIEAAGENGAGTRGSSLGPSAVYLEARRQNLSIFNNRLWETLPEFNDEFTSDRETPFAKNIKSVLNSVTAVAERVEKTLADGFFPLILSGDHSNAIGSVSGIKNHFPDKKIGVIWVDAHLDLHSPYTTPSGNLHGMALNALIDKDNLEHQKNRPNETTLDSWKQLKRIGSGGICPKLSPEHIVFIGTRDFEAEENALVNRNNIRVFTPDDIAEWGIGAVIEKTLEHLQACDYLYVSYDVDSQDTTISTGTGTPVDGGLTVSEAETVFRTLFHHPKMVAWEISEINPLLDERNKMADFVVKLLSQVI